MTRVRATQTFYLFGRRLKSNQRRVVFYVKLEEPSRFLLEKFGLNGVQQENADCNLIVEFVCGREVEQVIALLHGVHWHCPLFPSPLKTSYLHKHTERIDASSLGLSSASELIILSPKDFSGYKYI